MLKLFIRVFGIVVDLNIEFPRIKMPRWVNQTPINENITNKEYNSFDEMEEEENDEVQISEIQSQALRFEEELKQIGIYDIPNASDIPPTYEIQDDVEIITNEFEKEQQDMIKDRR